MRKILIGICFFMIFVWGYNNKQKIEKINAKIITQNNLVFTIKPVKEISKKEKKLAKKVDSKEQFCKEVREGALDSEKKIQLIYTKNYMDLIDSFALLEMDDLKSAVCGIDLLENSEFDYLLHNIKTISITVKKKKTSNKNALITIRLTYYQTKKQEEKVDAVIALALYRMGLNEQKNITDLEKVKLIHDYIVNALSYQPEIESHSVYDAVITGKSGGYGYAMLAYKMFQEVEVPSRIVTGTAINTKPYPHAWNLVFVNGNWYYIDCAYDDPIGEIPMIDYQYFLVSNYTINYNHILSEIYFNEKFREKYAVSGLNYPWMEYLNQNNEIIIPSEFPLQTLPPILENIPSESPTQSPDINIVPTPSPAPNPSPTPEPNPIPSPTPPPNFIPEEIIPPVVDPSEVMKPKELFQVILEKAFENLKTPDYGYTEETLNSLPEEILQEIYNYIGVSIENGVTLKDLDEITMSIAGFLYEKGYES